MKTIKDAYKELKGDLSNSWMKPTNEVFLFFNNSERHYICSNIKDDDTRYQYICTVDEFNNYKESNMNKFDLEKALAGEKVVTRDGCEVTQFNQFKGCVDDVFAVLEGQVDCVLHDGLMCLRTGEVQLFMAPKQLSGFVNVDSDGFADCYSTRDAADACDNDMRIACIDLSQFEEGHGL